MNKIESQLSLRDTWFLILFVCLLTIATFMAGYSYGKNSRDELYINATKGKVIGYPRTIKESEEMWNRTPDQLFFAPGVYK
jgi:hypothetical protein